MKWIKDEVPVLNVENLEPWANNDRLYNAPYEYSYFDGDKFFNGFGHTQLQITDYWTLRHRSAQLFNDNLYARGIVRRLVTNIINTGLTLESIPDESLLGREDDSLGNWAEDIENRFSVWSKSCRVVDYLGKDTFGALQRNCLEEALVTGDCLIIVRVNRVTKTPTVQLVSGNKVHTPLGAGGDQLPNGFRIRHGVETDKDGRVVAYHVVDDAGEFIRVPAYGQRTGRRMAWLVFGTDKRLDDLRGQPLLSIVLQSLKEIDRYRDAAQRKAVVNSILAMFITKTEDKQGTLPITGGAVRRDTITTDSVGSDVGERVRRYDIAEQVPGLVIEELQTGEVPKAFGAEGTDINLGPFETAIIQGVAWALEIPPEILTLSFSSNYSASQAAINEFKLYQNRARTEFGDAFCQPIYSEWFISEVLNQKITADGFLEAWRSSTGYETVGAWLSSDWSGAIKLSTDIKKQAEGYILMEQQGWITNERAARELTGTKWRKNMKRLRRERELKDEILGSPEPEVTEAVVEEAEESAAVVHLREVENG